ncbi:MAG: hypothetical protein OHK0046_05390 [Anaerolineae bacterium]
MTEPSSAYHPRDRALTTLDRIRAALADSDLQVALAEIDRLQAHLADWKRDDARHWLDAALRGELLLFNAEEARKRLTQWASSTAGETENREIALYQERVAERDRQRQMELQVQGVVAHCEALWQEASALERRNPPPHPDFLVTNYFTKAHDVATVACAEHPENARLDMLLQRAQHIQREKVQANKVYRMAMEDDRYEDAINMMSQFETIILIPRYRVADESSTEITTFDRMVPLAEAQAEVDRLARAWAAHRVRYIQEAVENHLEQYRPQAAVELIAERERLERFLVEADRMTLRELESRASNDLRLMEQAERRARQALQIMDENPAGAWDVYSEAYHLYPGAPHLVDTRAAIVERLAMRLEREIMQAEDDFNHKRMSRVTQAYAGAASVYSGKDSRLDELLEHFAGIEQQARTYEEYLRNAFELFERTRQLVERDVVAAGEALNALEDYPDVILEELPGMADLRALVRYRLNIELIYNQLYKLLYSRNLPEVERGIEQTRQYENEQRLRGIGHSLNLHRFFLMAQQHYAVGQRQEALTLLDQIALRSEHPDYDDARRLVNQIRADMAADDAPESPSTAPDKDA